MRLPFFSAVPTVQPKLQTLLDVGLSYVRLGQSATTLSGGEAQRVKLAKELSKRATGRTLYILDEPTTGLHFADIAQLLAVLQRLRDEGNTVIVIEHNLDVIKTADWVIDLGPEGGDGGGRIIATGTPEAVAANPSSHTGRYLKSALERARSEPRAPPGRAQRSASAPDETRGRHRPRVASHPARASIRSWRTTWDSRASSGCAPLGPIAVPPAGLELSCLGLAFAHPVGLAAGFDKNGDYLDALAGMGFSHVELGTVTPRPQPGNPKPRMFRGPGAAPRQSHGLQQQGRRSPGGTARTHALSGHPRREHREKRRHADRAGRGGLCRLPAQGLPARRLRRGQRLLAQHRASARAAGQGWLGARSSNRCSRPEPELSGRHGRRVPLLVKIAPDLDAAQIAAIAAIVRSLGIDGIIATNTTTDLAAPMARPGLPSAAVALGGLRCTLVRLPSSRQLRTELGPSFPIIGVGGIVDAERALTTLRAGADLIQIYTGFAVRGHALLEEIWRALLAQRAPAAERMIRREPHRAIPAGRRGAPARAVRAPRQIAELEAGIELNLAHLSPRAKIASAPSDPGRFVEDFCTWRENPHYRRFIVESPLAETAARLMRSRSARLYHDHLLVKEPGTRQPTPWHQDQPYYNIEGTQNASFWIPVDPVSRASTLEFVAGSHRGPWLMPRSFMDSQAKWFPEGSLADLPDIEARRDEFPILGWELEPGDAVCFHMLTLHASRGVDGTRRRRVFSVRFLGDDISPCAAALEDLAGVSRPRRRVARGRAHASCVCFPNFGLRMTVG